MNLSKIIVSLAVLLSLVGSSSGEGRMVLRKLNGVPDREPNADQKHIKGMKRRRLSGKVRTSRSS